MSSSSPLNSTTRSHTAATDATKSSSTAALPTSTIGMQKQQPRQVPPSSFSSSTQTQPSSYPYSNPYPYPYQQSLQRSQQQPQAVPRSLTSLVSPPVANAGMSQIVDANAVVMLDGRNSYIPILQQPEQQQPQQQQYQQSNRMIIAYQWIQLPIGIPVVLSNANTATPTFTAPVVSKDTTLAFSLRVMDNRGVVSTNPAIVYRMIKHNQQQGQQLQQQYHPQQQQQQSSLQPPPSFFITTLRIR